MKLARFFMTSIVATALCASGHAQEHQHQHEHGDHEELGEVNFRVSCNPPAQKQFNRAAALLHSFGYAQAKAA